MVRARLTEKEKRIILVLAEGKISKRDISALLKLKYGTVCSYLCRFKQKRITA